MHEFPLYRRRWLAAFALLALALGGCGGSDEAAPDEAPGPEVSEAPATTAAPAAEPTPQRAVDSETLPYAEVREELVYGHFAFPSDMIEPLPAVVVIHDWWGLNDHVRDAADQLAAEGYMVLAVDLYGGETVTNAADARQKMISVVENTTAVDANLRQALDFVGFAGAPKTATLGWGFGGGLALNAAIRFPEDVNAAAIWYGQVSADEDRLQALNAAVLGLFGERDRGVKVETVRDFEAALGRLRKDHSVHIYSETGHAFADPARSNYDPTLTADAWRRTLEFLGTWLAADADE